MPLYNPFQPATPAPRPSSGSSKRRREKLANMTIQEMLDHANPRIRQAAKRALKVQSAINTINTANSKGISTEKFLQENPYLAEVLKNSGVNLGQSSQSGSQGAPFWTKNEFKEIITETQKYAADKQARAMRPSVAAFTRAEVREIQQQQAQKSPISPIKLEQAKHLQREYGSPISAGAIAAMVSAATAPTEQARHLEREYALPKAKTAFVPEMDRYGKLSEDEFGNPTFTPFRLDEEYTSEEVRERDWQAFQTSVKEQNLPWWKEKFQLATFKFFQGAQSVGDALTAAFSFQKELVAQEDNLTVGGSFLNLAYNSAAFLHAKFGEIYYSVFDEGYWEKAAADASQRLDKLYASGMTDEDRLVQDVKQKVITYAEQAARAETSKTFFQDTVKGFRRTWDNFKTSLEEETPQFGSPEYKEWVQKEYQERQRTAEQARAMRPDTYALINEANSLVNTDPEKAAALYDQAIEKMMEVQKLDALSDPIDPTWSFTWAQEPERERVFRESMASLELQKGAPLTKGEVRRLKMYYENTWREFWGEAVFDITNVIPAAAMTALFKPLSPKFWDNAAGQVTKLITKSSDTFRVKGWVKTADVVGGLANIGRKETIKVVQNFPVISYLRRQTVATVASKRQNAVFYLFSRISGSYKTVDNFVNDLENIGRIANEIKFAPNEAAARTAFDAAKAQVTGLNSVTYDEFKRFFDVLDVEDGGINFTKWRDLYREAAIESEPELRRFTEQALRATGQFKDEKALLAEVNRQVKSALESPNAGSMILGNFSEKFAGAYTDAHRLYKGSVLFDDSISGNLALFFRKLADDAEEDSLVRKIFRDVTDKWEAGGKKALSFTDQINHSIAAGASVRSKAAKQTALLVANTIETMVKIGKIAVDIWAMFVLSLNPRWIVQNYIDSSIRAWIAGTNPLDSAATMALSLHRQLVDELGFLPIELGQSLARDGLNFSTSVTGRLIYGWKPLPGPLGIISYFQYEVDRLKDLRKLNLEEASYETAKAFSQRFPQGSMLSKLASVMGGVKFYGQALSGAAQDFNTAIEFTLRLRLFHGEYFKNLKRLERVLNENGRGYDLLSPALQGVAKQIWNSAESNPRKIQALVESIVRGGVGDNPAEWSSIVPPRLNEVMGALTDAERSLMISDIRNKLDSFVDSIYINGKKPTAQDFNRFFDDVLDDFQNTVNIQLSNSKRLKTISSQIGPQSSSVPDVDEISIGSAAVEKERITSAVERLGVRPGRFNPLKSFDDFKVAMTNYAPIEVVPGNERHIFVGTDGNLRVTIGKDLLEGRTKAEINDLMHEVALKAFVQHEAEFAVSAGFKSTDAFEEAMRIFVGDDGPARLLSMNADHFTVMVEEMEHNPIFRRILERTKGRPINYESAWRIQMQNLPFDKLRGEAWFDIVQARADRAHLPPAHVRHAAIRVEQQTLKMQKLLNAKTLPDDLSQELRNFLAMYDQARKDLGQFYLFTEPGPKMLSGEGRSLAWEQFYWRQTEAYDYGEALKSSMIEMINNTPDEALAALKKFNSDFYTNFLNTHGITDFSIIERAPKVVSPAQAESAFAPHPQYPEHRAPITNFKITRGGKMFEVKSDWARKDLYERFLSPEKKAALLTTERWDLSEIVEEIPIERQLYQAVQDSFKLTNEQAQMYSRIIMDHVNAMVEETGQDVEYFLRRMGFLRVEGALRAPDALRQAQAVLDNEGRYLLYGFGAKNTTDLMRQTSIMFYEDLRVLAHSGSERAVDDMMRLGDFLELQTGKKIIKGKLDDEHIQVFADVFQKYVEFGDAPNAKLKKPFERFSTWMSKVAGNVLDKTVASDLPEDVLTVLDRMFTAAKTQTPEAANRTLRVMARNSGVEFKNRRELLEIINESVAPLKKADKRALRDAILATKSMTEDEADGLITLLEYRARAWGALNNRNPSEYFDTFGVFNTYSEMEAALKKAFDGLPTTTDRRLPAFEQLRAAWDTMDDDSRRETFRWLTEMTLVDPLSGTETLVAKAMSQKPDGWFEATSDLNALTAINNTWGHGAGDELIRGIGNVAKEEVRKVGGRVFRVGGDEFTYWFPDEAAARQAMDAIDKRVFTTTFNVGGKDRVGFSMSYGIAENAAAADEALYADKLRRIESGQRPKVRDMMPETVKVFDASVNKFMDLPYVPVSDEILAKRIVPINRDPTDDELEGYARALARTDESNVAAAIRGEPNKAVRRKLINKIHDLNPGLAERVARSHLDLLRKESPNSRFFLKSYELIKSKLPNGKHRLEDVGRFLKGKGISKEELYWSGLQDILDSAIPGEVITRDELLRILDSANVSVSPRTSTYYPPVMGETTVIKQPKEFFPELSEWIPTGFDENGVVGAYKLRFSHRDTFGSSFTDSVILRQSMIDDEWRWVLSLDSDITLKYIPPELRGTNASPQEIVQYLRKNGLNLTEEGVISPVSVYQKFGLFDEYDEYTETVISLGSPKSPTRMEAAGVSPVSGLGSEHFEDPDYLYHLRSQAVIDGNEKYKILLELQSDAAEKVGKYMPGRYKEQGLRQLAIEAMDQGATRIAWISDPRQLYKIEGWISDDLLATGFAERAQNLLKFYLDDFPKTIEKVFGGFGVSIKQAKVNGQVLNYIDITPEMRVSLLKAESMFKGETELMGVFQRNDDVYRAVAAFRNADVDVLPHEFGHMFRTELPADDLRIIERATNLSEGEFDSLRPVWKEYKDLMAGNLSAKHTAMSNQQLDDYVRALEPDALRYEKAEEMFADGFVRYLRIGKSPIPELDGVFEKFKRWLSEIWRAIKSRSDFSMQLTAEVRGVYDRLFQVPVGQYAPAIRYNSLSEVPLDTASRLFNNAASAQIRDNLNAAFDAWKQRYDLQGLPQPALKDFHSAKAYVKEQFENTTGDLANQYRILMWRFEQFEDSMLENMMKQGFLQRVDKTVDDFFAPLVDEFHMDDGVKSFMRNGVHNRKIYDQLQAGIQEWRKFLTNAADEGTPFPVLTEHEVDQLRAWAAGATERKAKLMELAVSGGEIDGVTVEGALNKTNRVMLDYQDRNNFDQLMKNFFPFWMFPARSLPFWVNTLATNPRIIMLYQKMRKMSESERYQAGAVTSKGVPLPSMENYIPIPALGIWINPAAPLSFRYMLDMQSYAGDMAYKARNAEEGDEGPYNFLTRQFAELSPVFGFTPGPWVQFGIKKSGVPTQQWSLIPHTSLIPPWWFAELGIRSEQMMNWLSPEPPWHDFLVERNMLEKLTPSVTDTTLTDTEKRRRLAETGQAIAEKGSNPLWQESYREFVLDEKKRNVFAFFTGFYPKEFSDRQADLLQARNEKLLRASAMNNSFQANILQIPLEEQLRWENHRALYKVDTPLGWLSHLYSDIGWVADDQGRLVNDPQQRAKLLAERIAEDDDARGFFKAIKELESWKTKELAALPIGANYEQTSAVLDSFYEQKIALEKALMPPYRYFGSDKPVSLIEQDIRNRWWKNVTAARPGWREGEEYEVYEQRLKEWEKNLPNIAQTYSKFFSRDPQIQAYFTNLDVDQPLDYNKTLTRLISETTLEGYDAWKIENDDIFTALNTVWRENYWNPYWDAVAPLKNEERDIAEMDFFKKNPPPNADSLYQWVVEKYGPDRFTREEVREWAMHDENKNLEVYDIDERHLQDVGETAVTRERIWNILSWAGPGKQRDLIENAFVDAGGNPDDLKRWYDAAHGLAWEDDPAHVTAFYDKLVEAANALNLKPPNRMQLEQFLEARNQNDLLNQLLIEELGDKYQEVINLYFFKNDNLGKAEFRKWRAENRDIDKLVKKYFYTREVFGYTHKLWASYYQWKPKPNIQNIGQSGALTNPSGLSSPSPLSGSDKKADEILSTTSTTRQPLTFTFGPRWPKGMKDRISQSLIKEIENAYRGYGSLSSSARQYLNALYKNHKEWRTFIAGLLALK